MLPLIFVIVLTFVGAVLLDDQGMGCPGRQGAQSAKRSAQDYYALEDLLQVAHVPQMETVDTTGTEDKAHGPAGCTKFQFLQRQQIISIVDVLHFGIEACEACAA